MTPGGRARVNDIINRVRNAAGELDELSDDEGDGEAKRLDEAIELLESAITILEGI